MKIFKKHILTLLTILLISQNISCIFAGKGKKRTRDEYENTTQPIPTPKSTRTKTENQAINNWVVNNVSKEFNETSIKQITEFINENPELREKIL